jgi:coenzyme F420-reducing hydrogenase delta subunit/Pyruvate/2-oxoacid:ferredoxin oxidoreductase delta subunit
LTIRSTQADQDFRPLSTAVLVVGEGDIAWFAAGELAAAGYGVVVLNPAARSVRGQPESDSKGRVEVWQGASLIDIWGFPGAFHVLARMENGRHAEADVGAIIVASDCSMNSPFPAWRLEESDRILTLARLEGMLASGAGGIGGHAGSPRTHVLISGFVHPAHPLSQKRGMEAAVQLAAETGSRVIFLLEDLKVADAGLERLSRKARDAGVIFVKLTDSVPVIDRDEAGIRISYNDEALGGRVIVRPDRIVVEEAYAPAPYTAQLAALLGIDTDPAGYLQGDNVHNQPIFTNRTGIWVAGQARGPASRRQCREEAEAAAYEAARLLGTGKTQPLEDRIGLDTRKCTICLTCYRLCPHRAISYVNRRPVFSTLACRACGICVAECPMNAIRLKGSSDDPTKAGDRGQAARAADGEVDTGGAIVAFCCRNSAYDAAGAAAAMNARLPDGLELVPVPCAGNVAPEDILRAFRRGAAGVMVLACHDESCKSVTGSRMARHRTRGVRDMLADAGIPAGRLFFGTLAPSEAAEFAAAVERMRRMNSQELKASNEGKH